MCIFQKYNEVYGLKNSEEMRLLEGNYEWVQTVRFMKKSTVNASTANIPGEIYK